MNTTILRRVAAAFALATLAGASHAHADATPAAGFLSGLMHPFGGLDHLLAMLAIGMWAAALGRHMVWALPLAFPALMAAGAAAAMAGLAVPAVEPALAASVLVLGLSVAGAWQAPRAVALAIAAVFGFLHGHAHGSELPAHAGAIEWVVGFLVATAALHLAGIGMGAGVRALPRGRLALRGGGAAIALTGAWLLAGMSGAA